MSVERAYALLQQAMAELQPLMGAAQPAVPQYAAPAPAPAARPAKSHEMKFGKYKGWTLQQIFQSGGDEGLRYLGWVADKYGINDDGSENPKYVKQNAETRAEAQALLGVPSAAVPAPAPAPQAYAPPAPAPVQQPLPAGFAPADPGCFPPAPPVEDDIPF